MLRSLAATHAASTSVKDPLWKYKWVQAHEPEVFQKAHKWLDVKEYLIARCTGEFVMTRDWPIPRSSTTHGPAMRAGTIPLQDVRRRTAAPAAHHRVPRCRWNTHRKAPRRSLASAKGRPSMEAAATRRSSASVRARPRSARRTSSGTSGWVGTVMDHQAVDVAAMMAGIVGGRAGKIQLFCRDGDGGQML